MGRNSNFTITFNEDEKFEHVQDIYEKVRRERRRQQKLEREQLIQFSSHTTTGFNINNFKNFQLTTFNSNYSYQLPISDKDAFMISTINQIPKNKKNDLNLFGIGYKRVNSKHEYFQITPLFGRQKFILSSLGKMKLSPNYIGKFETQGFLYPGFELLSLTSGIERKLYYGYIGHSSIDFLKFSSKFSFTKKHETSSSEITFKGGESTQIGYQFSKEISEKDNLNINTNCGYSFSKGINYSLDLSLSTFVTNDLEVGSGFNVSNSGIELNFNFRKDRNLFEIPITLYDQFSWKNLFYSTLIPSVIYFISSRLIIEPIKKRNRRLRLIEKRENNILITKSSAEKAKKFIESVSSQITKNLIKEESKRGLVIVNAKYGALDDEFETPLPGYIDVTQALQYLVNNSSINLDETSKSQLDGFYDPCPGELKSLEITYLFKGKTHYIKIEDEDELNIPLPEHLSEK